MILIDVFALISYCVHVHYDVMIERVGFYAPMYLHFYFRSDLSVS